MMPEQRQELLPIIDNGEEISPEWARILLRAMSASKSGA